MLAFAAAACVDPALDPVYYPDNAVAPVLSKIDTAYTMVEGETMTTFTFTEANWGIPIATTYKLMVCLSGNDFQKAYSLGTLTSDKTKTGTTGITVASKDMNNVLISLGCEAGVAKAIDFRLIATMTGTEQTKYQLVSNTVSSNLTAYLSEKTYGTVWVLGSFNGWSHDKALFLYNYAEDDVKYSGCVDFGTDHAANAFKLTGAASWSNDTGNWGLASVSADVDPASTTLLNASNDNITNYTGHEFYCFGFNKNSLLFTNYLGFDKVGVIGLAGDWDNDVVMAYTSYKQRFYVDVDVAAATAFKFRVDGAWTVNWGGEKTALTQGGGDIPIDAGKFRIYLDLNNWSAPVCTVSESAYGTTEGGSVNPEPSNPENEWSVIGEVGDSNWDTDYYMTQNGDVWTSAALTFGDGKQFKLRFNNDWGDANVAGSAADDGTVIVGEAMPAKHPGNNFKIADAGIYVISYDTKAETVTVNSMANKWSVIGKVEGTSWDTDFYMNEDDGVWTSGTIAINGEFKLRYNSGWDTNLGGPTGDPYTVTVGTPFTPSAGGGNLNVPTVDAKYVVVYDANANTVTVNNALPSNTWSLIGVGGDWNNDHFMTEKSAGLWVSDPTAITANTGFKVRFNHDWGTNRGAVKGSADAALITGKAVAVVQDGDNVTVPSDGTYTVVYDANREQIYLVGWGVIGAFTDNNWASDVAYLKLTSDNVWTSDPFLTIADGQFKIRWNGGWDINRGDAGSTEPYQLTPLTAESVAQNGKNFSAPEVGWYRFVYDATAETITLQRCGWGVVGVVNGTNWDAAVDPRLAETAAGKWSTIDPVTIGGEFKIRWNNAWDVNRGSSEKDAYTCTLGTAFTVANGGANVKVPANDSKYNVAYDSTAETMTVTAAE